MYLLRARAPNDSAKELEDNHIRAPTRWANGGVVHVRCMLEPAEQFTIAFITW